MKRKAADSVQSKISNFFQPAQRKIEEREQNLQENQTEDAKVDQNGINNEENKENIN